MLASEKRQFLFIHVPKTAGLSVAAALNAYSNHAETVVVDQTMKWLRIRTNRFGPLAWRRGRTHVTALQARAIFGQPAFDGYFKFAFVRNPWDRLVSYYHYLKSNTDHHRHQKIQQLGGFKAYLEYESLRNKAAQTPILTGHNDDLLVDFVGRFENLRDDFATICREIQVTATMPHRNATEHRDYRTYYDDDTAEFVATHWAEDIRRFGYTFDDAQRKSRLAS